MKLFCFVILSLLSLTAFSQHPYDCDYTTVRINDGEEKHFCSDHYDGIVLQKYTPSVNPFPSFNLGPEWKLVTQETTYGVRSYYQKFTVINGVVKQERFYPDSYK